MLRSQRSALTNSIKTKVQRELSTASETAAPEASTHAFTPILR
jgi:hypothetical protein